MTGLLFLLLAAPEPLLGPFAEPGVPVILWSEAPEEVTVDGWPYRIDGATPVHPQRVPGSLPGLQRRPAGRLAGVVGVPPASRDGGPRLVGPLGIPRLREEHWPALDVFDCVLVMPGEPLPPVLLRWARAGGMVVVVGGAPQGTVRVAPDLESALDAVDAAPPRAPPRPGNVRPDLYDLVPPPRGPATVLRAARWLVLGAGAAMALQVVLAAMGRLLVRRMLVGLTAVAVAGGATGLLRGARDYRPLARGRIVEDVALDGTVRSSVYDVYVGVGPGAVVRADPMAVPIHYRAPGDPWWQGPERECAVPPGVIRIFRRDSVADAPAEAFAPADPPAPSAEPGEPPLLRRTAAQR